MLGVWSFSHELGCHPEKLIITSALHWFAITEIMVNHNAVKQTHPKAAIPQPAAYEQFLHNWSSSYGSVSFSSLKFQTIRPFEAIKNE